MLATEKKTLLSTSAFFSFNQPLIDRRPKTVYNGDVLYDINWDLAVASWREPRSVKESFCGAFFKKRPLCPQARMRRLRLEEGVSSPTHHGALSYYRKPLPNGSVSVRATHERGRVSKHDRISSQKKREGGVSAPTKPLPERFGE